MRERVDLSEKEKLEQLHAMVVNSSWLDDDKPCEEFKELLSSLPIETVIVFPRTPYPVTSGYPNPTRYPVFLSIPDPTRFSFGNHRVAGNPKHRVLPDISGKPEVLGTTRYSGYHP